MSIMLLIQVFIASYCYYLSVKIAISVHMRY